MLLSYSLFTFIHNEVTVGAYFIADLYIEEIITMCFLTYIQVIDHEKKMSC